MLCAICSESAANSREGCGNDDLIEGRQTRHSGAPPSGQPGTHFPETGVHRFRTSAIRLAVGCARARESKKEIRSK